MTDFLMTPFYDFEFMRRALMTLVILSVGATPVGVFLVLRRLSLMGDALAHAVLPGVAVGYLISGLSLLAMALGGMVAGIVIAMVIGMTTRHTHLHEDASSACSFLISLAVGVVLLTFSGHQVDLMHVLFGSVLAIDDQTLSMVSISTLITVLILAIFYRPLVMCCVDPLFARQIGVNETSYRLLLLSLVVVTLVSGFQALGTLMSLGLVIIPAVTSRFWARSFLGMCAVALICALLTSISGLLVSYYMGVPSGPAVICILGIVYIVSMLLGRYGSVIVKGKHG